MDADKLRLGLIEMICRLPAEKLLAVVEALRSRDLILKSVISQQPSINAPDLTAAIGKDWPHAPIHRLGEQGAYMLTAGTLHRAHVFCDAVRLDMLENQLLTLARKHGWHLEAWAVFSNHYHFIGYTPLPPPQLREFVAELHANTAREVNRMDNAEGRQVWHNFWDKRLTYEKSYFARLNYVHQNAVKHGLVQIANQYRWCSASWFEQIATPAQVKTIYRFKTDRLQITDDFEPLAIMGLGS